MSDLVKQKPVRTTEDNSFKIMVVDGQSGTTATNFLTIAQPGDTITAGVNDYGVPVLGKTPTGEYVLLSFAATGGINVNVTDGTNDLVINVDGSINVVGDSFDIRQLVHTGATPDSVQIGDGTEVALVSPDGELSVQISQAQGTLGATAPAEAVQVAGRDDSGNLQTLNLNSDGSINAAIVPNPDEVKVLSFGTGTPAEDADFTHDYVVTDTKTFDGKTVLVGSDFRVKVKVGTWNGTAFTEKMRYYQDPTENRQYEISCLELLGDATNAIRVIVTNLDDDDGSDVAVTLQGIES